MVLGGGQDRVCCKYRPTKGYNVAVHVSRSGHMLLTYVDLLLQIAVSGPLTTDYASRVASHVRGLGCCRLTFVVIGLN